MLEEFFNILQEDYGWDIVRRQACRATALLPLPLLGFLWYGHPIDELLEDLGHATDETGIPMGLHRGLSAAAQLYPLVNRLRSGRF